MATIIAGGFETIVQADEAKRLLYEASVNSEYLCEFRVNPPGMHDTTVIGGDRDESPGAHEADNGATKGAAVGAAIGTVAGVAVVPLMGPAGIVAGGGVGAYAGSLVGAMKGGVDHEAQPDHTIVRPAEALIAVNVDGAGIPEERIVQIFEQAGAWQIEKTDGLWEGGEWKDFDAVSPPHLIGGRDPYAGANPSTASH
jgi:uncharacterized membrane protein